MITLWHCSDARSFRPLWTLEELGLKYELKMLPFPPRIFAKEYFDVNPLGTVPAFRDGETFMTESAAICEFVVTRYGPTPLAVAPGDSAYGAWLNWLYFGEATLTFPQTIVLRYSRLEPEERRQKQVVEDYTKWFLGRLRAVDAAMTRGEYLCAGRFTAADISVGYALLLATTLGLDAQFPLAVCDYWSRLQMRDGYQRGRAAQASAAASRRVT